jgi:hypothetical protein
MQGEQMLEVMDVQGSKPNAKLTDAGSYGCPWLKAQCKENRYWEVCMSKAQNQL